MKFLKNVQQMNIYHQQGIFFLQSYILMPFLAKNYHFWPKKVLLIFSARNWVKRSWYSYSTPFLGLVCKKLETVSFFFFSKGFGLADIWPKVRLCHWNLSLSLLNILLVMCYRTLDPCVCLSVCPSVGQSVFGQQPWRGWSPVEHRGNLSVHTSVYPYVH